MKLSQNNNEFISMLKSYTSARVALESTGTSKTTIDTLVLKEAHALAKDSLFQFFEKERIIADIQALDKNAVSLQSKAADKKEFLLRPDLGKRLNDESRASIQKSRGENKYDICITVSDGLSAAAVNNHALPLLNLLLKKITLAGLTIAPVCVVENGRVAISDETGSICHSEISLILIGERPGLSSPDSMGAYLTYGPKTDNTDADRNCVSNIHLGGLEYEDAAEEIFSLIQKSMRLKISGSKLNLQDNQLDNQ